MKPIDSRSNQENNPVIQPEVKGNLPGASKGKGIVSWLKNATAFKNITSLVSQFAMKTSSESSKNIPEPSGGQRIAHKAKLSAPQIITTTPGTQVTKTLEAFASKQLGMAVTVQPLAKSLTTGATNAPVYLVQDSRGELVAVIKEFEQKSTMEQEIENNDHFARNQTALFTAPKLIATATPSANNTGPFWLMIEAAKGRSISSLFAETPGNIDGLSAVVRTAAKGLANLHEKTATSTPNPQGRKQIIEKYQEMFREGKEVAIKCSNSQTLKHVLDKFESTELNYSSGCLTHGDFQPANVFVDPSSTRLTLIDFDEAANSIYENGYVGLPAYDVAYFSAWIMVVALENGITDEGVIRKLRNDFESQYREVLAEGKANTQSEEQITYMKILVCLRYLSELQEGEYLYNQLGKEKAEYLSQIILKELEDIRKEEVKPSWSFD